MRPYLAAHEDDVFRASPSRADVNTVGNQPEAGRVDVDPVTGAGVDDLRVPGDKPDPGHPGHPGRRAEGLGDPAELGELGALLQDEGGRQVARCRTHHGQVVHGSVDREVTDAAAGEEQGTHDEGVGGEGHPRAAERDDGGVPHGVPQLGRGGRVLECRQEQVLDELRGHRAAAVSHDDGGGIRQRGGTGPGCEVRHGPPPARVGRRPGPSRSAGRAAW